MIIKTISYDNNCCMVLPVSVYYTLRPFYTLFIHRFLAGLGAK